MSTAQRDPHDETSPGLSRHSAHDTYIMHGAHLQIDTINKIAEAEAKGENESYDGIIPLLYSKSSTHGARVLRILDGEKCDSSAQKILQQRFHIPHTGYKASMAKNAFTSFFHGNN